MYYIPFQFYLHAFSAAPSWLVPVWVPPALVRWSSAASDSCISSRLGASRSGWPGRPLTPPRTRLTCLRIQKMSMPNETTIAPRSRASSKAGDALLQIRAGQRATRDVAVASPPCRPWSQYRVLISPVEAARDTTMQLGPALRRYDALRHRRCR